MIKNSKIPKKSTKVKNQVHGVQSWSRVKKGWPWFSTPWGVLGNGKWFLVLDVGRNAKLVSNFFLILSFLS